LERKGKELIDKTCRESVGGKIGGLGANSSYGAIETAKTCAAAVHSGSSPMKLPSISILTCSFTLAMSSVSVTAAPFGATVIGAPGYLQPCDEQIDNVSATVVVDAPSRILVTIGGAAVTPDPNNGYGLQYVAVLTDSTGATMLARSAGNSVSVSQQELPISDTEVLFDPGLSTPYTLSAGTYQLKLRLSTSGSCGGNGPYLTGPPLLTYVLLSSVLDRIFASEFFGAIDRPTIGNVYA
jgi:hypothetical protein